MQDRLELPEAIKKAFEQSKGLPSDAELAQKKARDWDVVIQRGRRSLLWSRLKPVTALVATAAVVAMAVLLPFPGQNGTQSVTDQGQTAASKVDRATNKLAIIKQREAIYKQQGYELMFLKKDYGIDLIKNSEGVYAMKDGVKTKLLALSKGQMISQSESPGMSYVLLHLYNQPTAEQPTPDDVLYTLNTGDLTVKKVTTVGGNIRGVTLTNNDSPQLVYLTQTFGKTNEVLLMKQDLRTGQEQQLFRSTKGYDQMTSDGQSYVLNSGNEVVLVTEQGSKTVLTSERKDVTVHKVTGSQILYTTGMRNQYNVFNVAYTGKTRVMLYDIKQGQSRPVLPDLEGDQILGFVSPESDSILVGNFVPDAGSDTKSYKMAGTLQLWNVKQDQEPQLLYEKKTTWNEHWIEFAGAAKRAHSYILVPMHKQDFALLYDEAKGSITEIDPKEVPNLLE